MVYKSDLKVYDFETMEQYFEYIVESPIYGQDKPMIELIKSLSKDQRKDFIDWCEIWSDDANIYDPYVIAKETALSLI